MNEQSYEGEHVINAELATKTLDQIRGDLEHWKQDTWAKATDCGTVYCFGARAVELSGISIQLDELGVYIRPEDVPDSVEAITWPFREDRITVKSVATSLLGLSEEQAESLFHFENELEDLERLVNEFVSEAYTAEISDFLDQDTELEEGIGDLPEEPDTEDTSEEQELEDAPF